MENETITDEQIKNLEEFFELSIETDEDYQKLADIMDEDE